MAQRHHTSCVLHPHAPHVPPMHPPCPGPIMRGLGGSIHSSCELRHLLRAPLHTYCTAYIQCLCLICPYYKIICIKCTNHLEKRSNLHMSQSNQISEEVAFPETKAHTHMSRANLIPFFLEYRYCLPLSDIFPGRHVRSLEHHRDFVLFLLCVHIDHIEPTHVIEHIK